MNDVLAAIKTLPFHNTLMWIEDGRASYEVSGIKVSVVFKAKGNDRWAVDLVVDARNRLAMEAVCAGPVVYSGALRAIRVFGEQHDVTAYQIRDDALRELNVLA